MISCIVVEDQMPARNILRKYIGNVEMLDLKQLFSNALDALDFLSKNSVDMMFLDIHLPKLSGLDFLSVLKKKPLVVLTTAFPDYALQGYDLDVVDYLLKPFSFDRFLQAVSKVERQLEKGTPIEKNRDEESVLIKVGYDLVKIKLSELMYIQADGDYTFIFCKNEKYYVSYSLKYWTETLPADQFIRTHRSFLVNIQFVERVSSADVKISEKKIPLGRVYKKDFQKAYVRNQESKGIPGDLEL